MEQLFEAIGTSLGGAVTWMAELGILFAIFAALWIAFGVAVVWRQGSLDRAWQRVQATPLIVRSIVWLLFLPVMIGLWVWETTWPRLVRLAVVAGLAFANLLMFLPTGMQGVRP